MLQKYLLLWLVLSSFLAAGWPHLLGDATFDPFLQSKPLVGTLVATIMFCVGTLLPVEEVRNVARRLPLVLGGTALQYVSMPCLAWAVATAFGFTGDLRIGMILVGCVPGAMASNVLTMLARGNVSYSVGLTTSATILSPVIVPVALWLTLGAHVNSSLLWKSSVVLTVQVVAPVMTGFVLSQKSILVRHWSSIVSSPIANSCILWIIAYVVAANRQNIQQAQGVLLLALLLINLGGYLCGQLGGGVLGLDSGMRRALMLEIGMQNAGVGVSLAQSLFPEQTQIALPCGLFAFGCMATGTVLAEFFRRRTDSGNLNGPLSLEDQPSPTDA